MTFDYLSFLREEKKYLLGKIKQRCEWRQPRRVPYLGLPLVVQLGGEGDEAGALVDGEQAVPIPSRDAEADRSIWGGQKTGFEGNGRVERF